jgi:hypothetical protein
MPDLHRHAIKDTELLDPKHDQLEIRVEQIKQVINSWIDEIERVHTLLPVPMSLTYLIN